MQRARTMVVAVLFAGLALSVGVGVAAGAQTTDGTTAAEGETNLTVFVAPGSNLEAMQAAETPADYGNVTITARSHVTLSDTLVLQVSAPGLGDAVKSRDGNTTTEQFLSLLNSDRASMRGVEAFTTADTTPKVFSLDDRRTTAVTRVDDRTYQLVVNLSAVQAVPDENGNERPDDEPVQSIESGEVYDLQFSFDDSTTNGSMLVFPIAVEFESALGGNSPVLYPMPNQRVHALTTLAPGTELQVELTGTGADVFQRTKTVTVTGREQPEFTATYDLTNVSDGMPLVVVVRNDGTNVGEAEGRIPNLTASLSVPERIETKDRIRVSRVNFSQNGFLIVRAGGPDGPIVGNRFLGGGTYSDLTVRFTQPVKADVLHVSAYVDIDTDRIFDRGGPDREYRVDGSPVSAVVDVSGTTGTPAVTTRPPPDTTRSPDRPTTSEGSTPVDTPPGSESPGQTTTRSTANGTTTGFTPYTVTAANGPGFTVALAIAAIVGLAGLLAWRR